MLQGKKIGVVVPAYNEERLIGQVIETMPVFVDRIYIVDDYSVDKTSERVKSYLSKPIYTNRLMLIRHEINQGVGAAIVTGYQQAIKEKIDVTVTMDGDAQMNPDELEDLVLPVLTGQADYTKGNRLFSGEAWQIIPHYRYLGNATLSLLTKIASGYWRVTDSQTGYKAISLYALQTIPIKQLYSRYGYPNHLLTMLNVFDMRVQDIPVSPVYNIGEKSGIRLRKVIPRMSWLLLKCFLWRMKEKYIIRDFHPLVFFYFMAFTLLLLSLPFFARIFVVRFYHGYVPPFTTLAFMFTAITGLQFTLFGMWFDMDYNKALNIKGRKRHHDS